jgi:hypothetical protein
MNIVKPVLTGMALAIAATLTFSATDSAVAKTKKHDDTAATANEARPSDLGGSDRQLQGRFYKSSHKKHHKAKAST